MGTQRLLICGVATFCIATIACNDGNAPCEGANCDTSGDDSGAGGDSGGNGLPALTSTIRPSKRTDIVAVADPVTDTILIFGGDDGPVVGQIPQAQFRNDTWVFEEGFGWSTLGGGPAPTARGRYAATYDATNGRALLFGGRWRASGTSGNYTVLNDIWAFDFSNRTWSLVDDGSNGGPDGRYGAGIVFDGGTSTIYVYGGLANASPTNFDRRTDVWALNGGVWSQVITAGIAPTARIYPAYTYDTSRNRLVVFAGQVGDFSSPAYDDIYWLDLGSKVWGRYNGGGRPDGRMFAMLAYDSESDKYLMHGGHADGAMKNDTWTFDPTNEGWSEVRPADTTYSVTLECSGITGQLPKTFADEDLTAPERRQFGMWAMLGGDAYLFGGRSDCSDQLDDLWTYTGGEWIERLPARTGEGCARQGNACNCLCL